MHYHGVVVLNAGDDACSGTPVEYTANSGNIRSPGYATYTYPANSDCQWRITASSGYVRIFPKLQCGPIPNMMAALPNIGGALYSTRQSLADAHYQSAVQ